jgi:hypothetical protein
MRAGWLAVLAVGLGSLACLRGADDAEPIDTGPEVFPVPSEGWTPGGPAIPEPDRRRERKGQPGRGKQGEGKRGKRDRERFPPPDTRPSPRPDPPAAPGRDRQRGQDDGIEFIGQETWEVERSKLREWTSDPSSVGAHAEKASGGYRLESVREGSDASELGVRTGDVLRKVNGKSLKDADPVDLWLQLKSQTRFEVQLERGGEPRTHHYKIVD